MNEYGDLSEEELQRERERKEYDLWSLERALSEMSIEEMPAVCHYFITWVDKMMDIHCQDLEKLESLLWYWIPLSKDIDNRLTALQQMITITKSLDNMEEEEKKEDV
jgi:hypothetical protein